MSDRPKTPRFKRTSMALPLEHVRHLERLRNELAVRTHGQDAQFLEPGSVASAIRWLIDMDVRRRTNNATGWRHYLNRDPAGNVVVEWENVYTDDRLIEGFDNTRPLSDGPMTAAVGKKKPKR